MDVFRGWHNYTQRLEENWRRVVKEGGYGSHCRGYFLGHEDRRCPAGFPVSPQPAGEKILLKGNHDYWWSTPRNKIDQFLLEHGFSDMKVLHNCAYLVEGKALCGTRGWLYNSETAEDRKIVAREAGRLTMSMDEAKRLGGGTGGLSPLPTGV